MKEYREPLGKISVELDSNEIMDLILSVTDRILTVRKEIANPNTPYGNSQTERQLMETQYTVDKYQELLRYNDIYDKLQDTLDQIMSESRKSSNRQ